MANANSGVPLFRPSSMLEALSVFGPAQVPAWANLQNINTFCHRCSLVDWLSTKMYLEIADEYSFYPRVSIYEEHPTLGQVKESAHAGCHLCALILTCLLTMRYRLSVGVDPVPSGVSSIDDNCKVKVEVEAMAKIPPVYLNVTLDESGNHLSGWLDHGIPIVSDDSASNSQDGSQINFATPAEDVAKYWLEDCQVNHDHHCNAGLPRLPKRVIDVKSRPQPFLMETADLAVGDYATLSYCWGGYPVLTATQETISKLKAGFSPIDLPQTVRDAVWWTRKLGLQYLWVDSLCILQDTLSDWELELSSMAGIYRDATLTIAATASESAGYGCLPTRNKLNLAPCNPAPGVLIKPDYGRSMWIYQKGALEDRAWTFQEIQLSRRVLRCGGEELAWQCRDCKRREGDPTVRKVHDAEARGTFFGTRVLDDMKRIDQDGYRLWYQIVGQFIERRLSFSWDRLPALSGMASHFADIFQEGKKGYLAGLWRGDLLHGLVWRTLYPGRRVPYRAPSWSWAAFESKILYNQHALEEKQFCTEVLHVEVTVPGLNAYGKVTSGKLTMLGPVAPVPSQVYKDDSEVGLWKWQWPLVTWEFEEDPPLGCMVLRLQRACCLILVPVGRLGVYRRVGMVVTPTELEDPEGVKMRILDGLQWETRVLTVI
jgi:Heterokaryon incompatibility protein (HET)